MCEHLTVRRPPIRFTAVTLLAAVATLLVLGGCRGETSGAPVEPVRAAPPQQHELGWKERYPETGAERLVFTVRSFEVTDGGWAAEIGIANQTTVNWELPEVVEGFQRVFGVMLFASGDLAELDRLNKAGELPPPRRATDYDPALETFLPPGEEWSGRISAPGSLPAGSFVRVVFGPLRAVGDPPEGAESQVIWITDQSLELRPT
ncbi:MAG: hypothetical protein ACRC50_09695 [Gaiella sp.]